MVSWVGLLKKSNFWILYIEEFGQQKILCLRSIMMEIISISVMSPNESKSKNLSLPVRRHMSILYAC